MYLAVPLESLHDYHLFHQTGGLLFLANLLVGLLHDQVQNRQMVDDQLPHVRHYYQKMAEDQTDSHQKQLQVALQVAVEDLFWP